MPDGRVFFVPGQAGAGIPVILPTIWDPYSGALHEVAVPWAAGRRSWTSSGACLLLDGRVFFMPSWADMVGQAYIYDPELDRLVPAGEPVVIGYNGCTLLQDGRVLLVPCYGVTSPLIYDPRADTMTVSAAVVPAELQTGMDYQAAQLLPDGRVLLLPLQATKPLIYDPAADSLAVVDVDLGGQSFGGCGAAGGRPGLPGEQLWRGCDGDLRPCDGQLQRHRRAGVGCRGGWHGGALLADGRVLCCRVSYSDLMYCRIFDPADGTYTQPPALTGAAGGGAGRLQGRLCAARRAGGLCAAVRA